MKRLLKSFRENRIICVTALVLAVLQAVCCLAVPVLIGRAVGTGLQGKGYPDSYPIGMSRDAFALFLLVLPEEKGAQLSGLYELKDESPYSANGKYATNKKCFWLKDNADTQTARELFCDAATCALYEINKTTNLKSLDSYNMFAEKVSMRSLLIYAGRLNLTESDRAECYEAAQRADGLLKQQVAAVFLPYIYADAGMDCDAVQSAYLTKSLIKIIAVSALQFACAVVSGIFTAKCSTDAESSLRGELRNRLFSFSENGKGKFSTEEIRDIYQNSVARVGISLNFLISLIVYSVSVILIGGIMTFINQRFISLLILLCAVAVFIVIFVVYKLSYGKYFRMDENYLEYSETIEGQLADIIQIRAEKGEYFVKEKVANASAGIRRDERSVMKSVYFAVGSIGFFVNILTAAVVLWSGNRMLSAGLTMDDIVAYMQIAIIVITSLTTLGATVLFGPEALIQYKKVFAVLDEEEPRISHGEQSAANVESVVFDRVRLFENSREISFTANRGEFVVINGSSGSGKTSLINALLRENGVYGGNILINGGNIENLDENYPEKFVSLAPTQPVIFSDTLRSNILFYGGREENAGTALKTAACGFLGNTDTALGTFLSNGGEHYSGGQRSRISLACALSKKADIYLLDDCLSSLDSETFRRVAGNIKRNFGNSIVILVTHSPGADEFADKTISLQ